MSGVVDGVLSLSGVPAYALIALLVAGEAAALVGLVLPGEVALLLGGVLASSGRVSLPVLLVVAVLAAVLGDAVGYGVGRLAGPALQRSRPGRLVGPERWARGEQLLDRRGGPAILLGRWVGVLRALVPSLAGMGRLPYRTFLLWNAAGALVWAPAVVFAGYAAGANYRTVEHLLGRGGLLLGGAVVGVACAVLAVRAVRREPRRWRAALRRRLDPGRPLGRTLTLGLAVAVAAGAAFAVVLEDVLDGQGVAGLDRPALAALAAHRTPALTAVARAVTQLGRGPVVVLVAVAAALWWWRRGAVQRALVLLVAVAGSGAITASVKLLVGRSRPALPLAVDGAERGLSFPSGHSLSALALYGTSAYLLAQTLRSWPRVLAAGGLVLTIVAVSASRVYLGYHWISDVLGSWTLGVLWLSAVLTTDRVLSARRAGAGRAVVRTPGLPVPAA